MKKDVLSLTRSLVRPAHQVISFPVWLHSGIHELSGSVTDRRSEWDFQNLVGPGPVRYLIRYSQFYSLLVRPDRSWTDPLVVLIKNVEVVKNGAGSLQQFEMEKDYYIQKQKDEIALLRSQVSAIGYRIGYCLELTDTYSISHSLKRLEITELQLRHR